MPGFKIVHAASEKQGARTLLEAMRQVPPVAEALRKLEHGSPITSVGNWLQKDILAAFEEERERSQRVQHDLEFQRREVARFQRVIENIKADPLEQKSRRAEASRAAAERQLRETERELAELRQQRGRELAAKEREIEELQEQNVELKRLVAKQHTQLTDLLGSGTPQ